MLLHLIVSAGMVLVTVIVHGGGWLFWGGWFWIEAKEERAHHVPALSLRSLFFTLFMVGALFALHGLEIWIYAFAVQGDRGHSTALETAIYFSTISYAGIGYDDRYIDPAWRLVGAIEGIDGLLLLGWSTAFFVTMVTRLGRG
jgi:hypothetical protein